MRRIVQRDPEDPKCVVAPVNIGRGSMACSVIFHAITIGYRRKGVSPIKGGADTRAGGLFIPGRTLESRVDLLWPVQEVAFVAPDTCWGRT